jgi:nicotinamide riboside kinase
MEEKLAQRPSSCLKIVLFGPESTGKTTLSEDLSRYYGEPMVKEYMREYLQEVWDSEKRICEPSDLIPIAEGQMEAENRLASQATDLLICDTNLLELKVYSEAYYEGYCDPRLLKHALNHQYHLYFLTYIDVPWTPDDLRDKPHDREGMFQRFQNTLEDLQKPYVILRGDRQSRLKIAVEKIDQLIKNKKSEI